MRSVGVCPSLACMVPPDMSSTRIARRGNAPRKSGTATAATWQHVIVAPAEQAGDGWIDGVRRRHDPIATSN